MSHLFLQESVQVNNMRTIQGKYLVSSMVLIAGDDEENPGR